MPESRFKYLYERLGDHDFQQLVSALLKLQFTNYVPLPLRQGDGGRDGIDPSRRLIYQVKWSVNGQEKDPVSWLEAEIKGEATKIKRLAAEGTRKYVLVTNVASTGKAQTGTFDKLDAKLKAYSKDYGLEISCIWREALNGMVDSAPIETKWAYAEMLAGWDLVRYLSSEQAEHGKASGLRDLLRRVAAAQWRKDERIKFSQVELDREHLADLFVDVHAERIRAARRESVSGKGNSELGGAAAYLASKSIHPFTLVLGAPGQGKSTLSQYVCQAFRIAFLPQQITASADLPDIEDARFPIRLDLGDFAAWIQGYDVFDESEVTELKKGKKRPAAQSTIESFLAELMAHASGRDNITNAEVQGLFERVPSIVVLDGLDEVGNFSDRKRVVREIDLFCARGKSYAVAPKVIVTSRPNSAGLPEPDHDIFETISLSPLDAALRNEYLRKWCAVHNVRGNDGRTLRRNFVEKTREPYIGELAGNPMQLTILLFLLRQNGDATPGQRTELYDAYMAMLLAREANKHPESVRKHRNDLMEIVPFLGWYLQSRAERDGHNGRMAQDEVKAAMKHFQRAYGKPEGVVDELFTAATDRLWALTGKEEGTYEFEVLSLREYFAARYLYRYAGEGDYRFDHTIVFRELLRRPYWLNTVRFYGGNAAGSNVYMLVAGIKDELIENSSKHVRVASWSLLTDGVLSSRPIEAASVVDALTDDLGSGLLIAALDGKEISPLPESSHAKSAWARITAEIKKNPSDPQNSIRVRTLRELLGLKSEFSSWWVEQLQEAIGTSLEAVWLAIGADCEVAAGKVLEIPELHAEDGRHAQLILNTGLVPAPLSALENELIRAVLDGQASETACVRSEPAQIAAALSPAEFYAFGSGLECTRPTTSSDNRRGQAIQHLKSKQSPYAKIAGMRPFKKGEKGTTFPWSRVSTALHQHCGRCWLATEIAVIGAASPLRDGYIIAPNTEALGIAGHPATLIAETRKHRGDATWWRERYRACQDDLSRAEWAFALWAIAEGRVIDELLDNLTQAIESTPPRLQRAIRIAAQRINASQILARRMVKSTSTIGLLAEMLASRNPQHPPPAQVPVTRPSYANSAVPEPLANVAIHEKWLKVDQTATYH